MTYPEYTIESILAFEKSKVILRLNSLPNQTQSKFFIQNKNKIHWFFENRKHSVDSNNISADQNQMYRFKILDAHAVSFTRPRKLVFCDELYLMLVHSMSVTHTGMAFNLNVLVSHPINDRHGVILLPTNLDELEFRLKALKLDDKDKYGGIIKVVEHYKNFEEKYQYV